MDRYTLIATSVIVRDRAAQSPLLYTALNFKNAVDNLEKNIAGPPETLENAHRDLLLQLEPGM